MAIVLLIILCVHFFLNFKTNGVDTFSTRKCVCKYTHSILENTSILLNIVYCRRICSKNYSSKMFRNAIPTTFDRNIF